MGISGLSIYYNVTPVFPKRGNFFAEDEISTAFPEEGDEVLYYSVKKERQLLK